MPEQVGVRSTLWRRTVPKFRANFQPGSARPADLDAGQALRASRRHVELNADIRSASPAQPVQDFGYLGTFDVGVHDLFDQDTKAADFERLARVAEAATESVWARPNPWWASPMPSGGSASARPLLPECDLSVPSRVWRAACRRLLLSRRDKPGSCWFLKGSRCGRSRHIFVLRDPQARDRRASSRARTCWWKNSAAAPSAWRM